MKVLLLCMAILASLVSGVKAEELEPDFFKNYNVIDSVLECETGTVEVVPELVAKSRAYGDTLTLDMIGGLEGAVKGDVVTIGYETFDIEEIHILKCK